MNRLKKAGIPVYRTDESGTIVCVSDGETIRFNVSPGSYIRQAVRDVRNIYHSDSITHSRRFLKADTNAGSDSNPFARHIGRQDCILDAGRQIISLYKRLFNTIAQQDDIERQALRMPEV